MLTLIVHVNGADQSVECDPRTPLLLVLRNDLGLTAAKFGCGLGLCGACMVWVDGRPQTSCDLAVEHAVGRSIRTLEDLGDAAAPHPVQDHLLRAQAGQCGYCLAGIVMTAAALVRDMPGADRSEIAKSLDRHLCRCGAHGRILDAIEQAVRENTSQ